LLEKRQENNKKFNNIEIDWWYKFVYCKETDIDDDNDEDMKAREYLAKWPYENIWKQNSKARYLFNCEQTENDNEHYLWPIHEAKTVDNTIKINKRERCICKYQRYYDGQCGHNCVFVFSLERIISMNAGTRPENTSPCILRLIK